MLSQIMHRLESTYARYFNDTRPSRRRGPLFESRFRSELVANYRYFENACAYVLLNPLATKTPMAAAAENYRWSSAALVCSETTATAVVGALVEPFGDIEAILKLLPPTHRQSSHELRRRRLEALVSGAWLERELLLAGRSPDDYRKRLAAQAARRKSGEMQIADEAESLDDTQMQAHPTTLVSRRPFAGFELATVESEIRDACERFIPPKLASPESHRDLVLYVLHRFTDASLSALARATGQARDAARRTLERIRRDRLLRPTGQQVLWALEWALRWRLRAAPHRL